MNGTWQLQPSNDDAIPTVWNHSVPVPALVDVSEPRYDWKSHKYHWYKTEFDTSGSTDLSLVVIEQAMFGTDVWLNGNHLGGDIACYTSQEYDVRSALRVGEKNELIVRVGQRENLPLHNAAGKDLERMEWIPGIWGDVCFVQCGNPRVKLVQVIPHVESGVAEFRVTVENISGDVKSVSVSSGLRERQSKMQASTVLESVANVSPDSTHTVVVKHNILEMRLWSPDDPFLYEAEISLCVEDKTIDAVRTTFGMREFRIEGSDFHFNGKRIFLKGGNIAFHRFLSDADRGTLPWNHDWVKKLLIDIPKANNFNFFRNHIGQMYNRWYDIADEHGMLLQNEWMFWTTTGTKEQITKEFTRWLQDNWNHPSIIIWDALNECSDDVVQMEIVPAMKELDPTRPWESVDFVEEHPYIYSRGPVLNNRKFGFTRSLEEIERSTTPTVLNEFCWWWLDKEFNPSFLTKDVVERWLGPQWTKEQLIAQQSFLVQELVELFRRMRVDAIQPFVYLSNNAGPTAHWFVGDIKDLTPKPILATLKNAFAPVGVSLELWDGHFFLNESRTLRVFVFNDQPFPVSGAIRWGVVTKEGEWIFESRKNIRMNGSECAILPCSVAIPAREGEFMIRAEVLDLNEVSSSYSEKRIYVFSSPPTPAGLQSKRIALLEHDDELEPFLSAREIQTSNLREAKLDDCDILIAVQEVVRSQCYQSRLDAIKAFLESGKTVILVEPELSVDTQETFCAALGVELTVEKRVDADKGGYDSYVFADDLSHPLWKGISQDHLKMFNGGYGGEIVSQHTITSNVEVKVHARCGMHLGVIAIFEIPFGNGRIIVSRLQVRGRLDGNDSFDVLYARKVDPVLQRFVLNLLAYASNL